MYSSSVTVFGDDVVAVVASFLGITHSTPKNKRRTTETMALRKLGRRSLAGACCFLNDGGDNPAFFHAATMIATNPAKMRAAKTSDISLIPFSDGASRRLVTGLTIDTRRIPPLSRRFRSKIAFLRQSWGNDFFGGAAGDLKKVHC